MVNPLSAEVAPKYSTPSLSELERPAAEVAGDLVAFLYPFNHERSVSEVIGGIFDLLLGRS